MGKLVFVTGGARSGKSRFAEQLVTEMRQPVVYLATMVPGDEELQERVAAHRRRRPSEWKTVEEALDVAAAIRRIDPKSVILLDCLSLWVSNALLAAIPNTDAASPPNWVRAADLCAKQAQDVLEQQRARPGAMVVVSNEVGMGIVPIGALARVYRDALGLVNQLFAGNASAAYLIVSGLPFRLK